jgi:hypothetical protein
MFDLRNGGDQRVEGRRAEVRLATVSPSAGGEQLKAADAARTVISDRWWVNRDRTGNVIGDC